MEIPMDRAGFVHTAGRAVHGAMPQPIRGDGKSYQELGEQISRAGEKIASFMMAAAEKEGQLAQRQYLADWQAHNNQLEQRMAANPGDVEKFGEWAVESDKAWAEKAKGYKDRMLPAQWENFSASMNGERARIVGKRQYIAIQARASRIYTQAKNNIQQFCDAGNFAAAEETVKSMQSGEGKVFSDAEAENYLNNYIPMKRQTYEIKTQMDQGNVKVALELLKAQGEDGYSHYTKLSPEQRRQWIAYGERQIRLQEQAVEGKVLAGYADGRIEYPQEKLDADRKAGILSDRQYAVIKGWNETFLAKQKRETATQKSREENVLKASRVQLLDKLESVVRYDNTGRIQFLTEDQYLKAAEKIRDICGNDYGLYNQWMNKFQSFRAKEEPQPGKMPKEADFRKTPLYQGGLNVLRDKQDDGMMAAAEKGWLWGVNAKEDTSLFARHNVKRALMIDLEEYCLKNPDGTLESLESHLNEKLEKYNGTLAADIAAGNKAYYRRKVEENRKPGKFAEMMKDER